MFYELCTHLNDRNNFYSSNKVKSFIKLNQEAYRSYFGYDELMIKHIQNKDEIKPGTHGKFYLKQIVLDVDRKEDSFETLINRVRKIADELISTYDLEDNFQLWFSGRGFHFHLPNIFGFEPTNNLPEIVKETLYHSFPDVDLKPVHKRGLIRIGYTMNLKTSLYKVPIRESEIWFLNEKDVIKWASERRKIDLIKYQGWKTFPESIIIPKGKTTTFKSFQSKPTRFVTCMQNCYNTGPVVGTRHERLLRIISWLYSRGIPIKATIDIVMGYMKGEGGQKEVKLVNYVYRENIEYSCKDKVMQEFCSPQCVFYKKKNYLTEIVSANDIENEFASYIQAGWKKNSINLSKILGFDKDEFWIQPQDVVGIIGGTGLNKTGLLQNIAIQLKEFAPVLYISTEFSNNLLLRRFSQIAHNMTEREVIKYYEDNLHIANPLSTKFNFIKFLNTTPTFEDLENLIRKYKPRVLMIDVIDDIISLNKRGTEGESKVGQGIKDLGRKYNHFTFYVHHISKNSAFTDNGDPKELNIHSGKGSSTIEQKSDTVIGIMGYQDKNFRVLKSLKQRDNAPFQHGYIVNMKTFRFSRDLTCNEIIIPKKAKLSR